MPKNQMKVPVFRKLKGYAFDPSLSLKIDTVEINDIIYKIPWENILPGPIGEYIEVVDYDPSVNQFYTPIDLDEKYILAQDGLTPSESNPQFHQQMVYAVAMLTIKNFEKALGRKIIWSPKQVTNYKIYEEYVPKLRIYPHAIRQANAYYSPIKKALLFGYFLSTPSSKSVQMPESLVFTCLSHDIIAHETTHAILDGMHNYYNEPTNPDMLAFHEAFSDIVALFQHFTFPEVLTNQIAKTRGELTSQNLLGQLAQEFGSAIGGYGSLRDAIGEMDEQTGQWKAKIPNPDDYKNIMEPHARGSILVAAVFDAFINIYKSRVADLIRIASHGTGILPQGELSPDLINRLSQEAAKSAKHVLRMCIRALDYCPPVDLTFGDYLRGIITADVDLVSEDDLNYRLSFIESFRKRGIFPQDVKTLSVESLQYANLNENIEVSENEILTGEESKETDKIPYLLNIINEFLREYAEKVKYKNNRKDIYETTKDYIRGRGDSFDKQIQGLHERIGMKFLASEEFSKMTGLAFLYNYNGLGIRKSTRYDGPSFQIQNLRLVSRVGPSGNQINDVVFSIIQRSGVSFKGGQFTGHFNLENYHSVDGKDYFNPISRYGSDGQFEFKGGCTLIFDLDKKKLKFIISKPIIDTDSIPKAGGIAKINMKRLFPQYKFQFASESQENEYSMYFGSNSNSFTEPFAFLHQH
jgi:hypothetical protein